MSFDANIPAFHSYNEEMRKSSYDKTFFIDKIADIENILDFGCGDGSILRLLHSLFPEYTYYGYDISKQMIRAARKDSAPLTFTDDWYSLPFLNNERIEKSAVLISSTIHEVYSYGDAESISTFWDRIFNSGFKYVIIRDMFVSEDCVRPSDKLVPVKVRRKADPGMLADFERVWGPIGQNRNLTHWLLKYRWKENWRRELPENYLPITIEQLMKKIPTEYEVIFYDHSPLLFIQDQVRRDFGVEFYEPTHLKMILKRIDL